MKPRILIVDDGPDPGLLRRCEERFEVQAVDSTARASNVLARESVAVVLCDVRAPERDGIALLAETRREYPEVEVILVAERAEIGDVVAAMKAGAFDFLPKPLDPKVALDRIERAVERWRSRIEPRAGAGVAEKGGKLIGVSPAWKSFLAAAEKLAPLESPALIVGEPGTGKRTVARWIHEQSRRASGPFLPIRCALFPREPAHRGASRGSPGDDAATTFREALIAAEGGTLLLDEIAGLSLEAQDRLEIALGAAGASGLRAAPSAPRSVRAIATTRRDLAALVEEDRFRADLYARFHPFALPVPPLRERRDDIVLLARHFLAAAARRLKRPVPEIEPPAIEALERHGWPGNVAELAGVMERACAVSEGRTIRSSHLGGIGDRASSIAERKPAPSPSVRYVHYIEDATAEAARRYLVALLGRSKGNVSQAARDAGVERESFHRLLRRYGIRASDFRDGAAPAPEDR